MAKRPRVTSDHFPGKSFVLLVIVFSQFACVTLWFVPNAILTAYASAFPWKEAIGWITAMVQIGFIAGTLTYAALNLADRFSPSKVFVISAILAAVCNAIVLVTQNSFTGLLALRGLTGFFIAGVYPVGMKIIADYFDRDTHKALGYLVGALVLGTAFPHFLAAGTFHWSWTTVIILTSTLAVTGGAVVWWFIPDGPHRKTSTGFHPSLIFRIFQNKPLRKAALGYFGHMWELYAFWAFVPLLLKNVLLPQKAISPDTISIAAFWIIAVGALSCVVGGYTAKSIGSYRVAFLALSGSFFCCLLSPFVFHGPAIWMLPFLLIWGMLVIADSPQFSSLVATHALPEFRGTSLTMVNSIGFSITVVSILLVGSLSRHIDTHYLMWILAPGPLLGLLFFRGMRAGIGKR